MCWTSLGPVEVSDINAVRERALGRGLYLEVRSVDKFPPMLDFVVPTGVRVADAARVRLGAHLAEGTTVMHEGFVNFNAGTLGPSMVEGRISQGVVVDADSDIGGGASIMGTLSGGGTQVISVGKRCLLGANSGLGVSPRRRLHRRGRAVPDRGHDRHPPGRTTGQGARAERKLRTGVPPQQRHRCGRGRHQAGQAGQPYRRLHSAQ